MPRRRGAPQTPGDPAPFMVLTDTGERIDLLAHARTLGLRELPPSSASEPTPAEEAIRCEFERQHAELVDRTQEILRAELKTFWALEESLPRTADLDRLVHDAATDLERLRLSDASLVPLRRAQQLARRHLRIFADQRGLNRPARYPASPEWQLGLVGVIALLEALLNVSFFAPGAELGLLGGGLQAGGVALVNAVGSVLAGYLGLRYLHDPRWVARAVATVGLVASAIGLAVFHLAVARWRDLSAAGGSPAQVLGDLVRSPLDLSLQSGALLGLGLIAAVLCLWKGAGLDDLVPGYGDLDRRFARADRALRVGVEALQASVHALVTRVALGCDATLEKAAGIVREMEQSVVRMQDQLRHYEHERGDREARSHLHLRGFRQTNRAIRTSPPPAYFADYPPLTSQIERSVWEAATARLVAARGHLDGLRTRAKEIHGGQPARMAAAGELGQEIVRRQLDRADAGRGDGSERGDGEARWAS